MTNKLMSLDEITICEEDWGFTINTPKLFQTARAAHEWKADAERLAQCVRDVNSACNEYEKEIANLQATNVKLNEDVTMLKMENGTLKEQLRTARTEERERCEHACYVVGTDYPPTCSWTHGVRDGTEKCREAIKALGDAE